MRKYIYNVVIILFVLQMSHVQVFANYEKEDVATAHSIETLQSLINKEVMHLSSEFSIRYTGDLAKIKDELTEITKNAIENSYIYTNISSFQWKYEGYSNNIVIAFAFTYHLSQTEALFVEQTLENIIAPMHGLSDIEKLQAAHDFIVLSAEYSKETEGSQYSPYTLLTENKGVCQAYALVLYRMLEMLGFEVQYVPGKVGEQLHAWVLVKLDHAWYHIDVTWDDPLPDRKGEVRYQYFLVSDRQLAQDHTWDYKNFPAATSEKYIDLQEETKRQSLATPIQHQLNQIMGLSIIEENRLAVQPLVEQPMKLITQKTNKQDNSIQFNFTEWPPMLVESSITAFVVLQPKFKHVTKQKAMKWLGSFYRTGKRMPQEKYVIIKEVSQ
ncbi:MULTISPECIES: transglutaminase domain-containing protein [Lysinibacillus]|uniref:transglutaminase domain-containing protein n=1 Tax=Lysinibacillus TaxID=400634 RepID=UPI001C8B5D81|nr:MULTISPECIES: transglutaminase domain-containing protein [Lysinibacillus]WHP41617.1 transglutaminase domain-containing protein [Lysinibacillus boronitolerans]MBX8944635.1 S-layer protein [Lysinibacillus sp. K60]UNT56649.1 S-layer protein [Lysinibacillus capsici]UUV23485.1 S-layer protein [Lysinibacillus sp. FN11]UYB46356.1 S-layer protein [Lysinibacillus capsici]